MKLNGMLVDPPTTSIPGMILHKDCKDLVGQPQLERERTSN